MTKFKCLFCIVGIITLFVIEGCTTELECSEGREAAQCSNGTICIDNECRLASRGERCKENAHCLFDSDVCDNGTCVEGTRCNDRSDCLNEMPCINHICRDIKIGNNCKNDSMCPRDAICHNNECIEGRRCSSNIECRGYNDKDVCVGTMCAMLQEGEKCVDNECSGTLVCDSLGICRMPCEKATDCTPNSTHACVNRVCIPAGQGSVCTDHSQCGVGSVCINNACTYGKRCVTASDCDANETCHDTVCKKAN